MWLLLEILNVFKILTLKKKQEWRYLIESTEIENATFPYKTAPSESNIKNK